MTLVLNLTSGVLHLSPRCAGGDTRLIRQYHFTLEPDEELVGFLGMRYERLCLRCIGGVSQVAA